MHGVSLVWIAYFLWDADTPGHKIFGPADTPLRTRFRADGRKSFLARTCSKVGTRGCTSVVTYLRFVMVRVVSMSMGMIKEQATATPVDCCGSGKLTSNLGGARSWVHERPKKTRASAPWAVPKAPCRDMGRHGLPHIIPDEI